MAEGDSVTASIVGNVITAYTNGVKKAPVKDDAYSSGSGGMGFNLFGCTGTNGDYGFTSFSAQATSNSPPH